MKVSRDERPKDIQDILMIDSLDNRARPTYAETLVSEKRYFLGAIIKKRYTRHRVILFFGLKIFKYNLRSKNR